MLRGNSRGRKISRARNNTLPTCIISLVNDGTPERDSIDLTANRERCAGYATRACVKRERVGEREGIDEKRREEQRRTFSRVKNEKKERDRKKERRRVERARETGECVARIREGERGEGGGQLGE